MSKIPNYFHFVFGLRQQNERFHLVYYLCLKSCLEINQPEKIFFYYHYEPYGPLWDLIKPQLTLIKIDLRPAQFTTEVEEKASDQYRYAHAADFVRLEQVIARGGVYADIDTIFIRKLPPALFNHDAVVGLEADVLNCVTGEVKKSVCNAFFLGAANSTFLQTWLTRMPHAFDGSWSNHACQLPYQIAQEQPDTVTVLPDTAFFALSPHPNDLKRLYQEYVELPQDAYNLHLWNHLWWSPWRKDFSTVSHRDFTVAKLQRQRTTYSELAKPYLPEVSVLSQLKPAYLWRDLIGLIKNVSNAVRSFWQKVLGWLHRQLRSGTTYGS